MAYYLENDLPTWDAYTIYDITGAQGLTILKSGVYNVTVAGAAGGRGVCNVHSGRGAVVRTTMELSASEVYGVLVGQRGVGPCDLTQEIPECQMQPTTVNESNQCEHALQSRNDNFILYFGGGGGGGASHFIKVGAPTLSLVAGGGGGSSQLLDYSVAPILASVQSVVNCSGLSNKSCYQALMDARLQQNDLALHDGPGERGYRALNSSLTAGAGGGVLSQGSQLLVDGTQLNSQIPAVGGEPCYASIPGPDTLPQASGGYGGGGGGCTEGGGGGGYTGGDLLSTGTRTLGGGGYSKLNGSAEFVSWNDGDGYVDIVPTDCGCQFGCIVYEEEEEYECTCPGSDTYLAPPEYSECFRGRLGSAWTAALASPPGFPTEQLWERR